MGLALDWANGVGDQDFAELLRQRALDFYGADVDLPLRFEPSGHDFLSPSLAEADLMRRVASREKFAAWLDVALPFEEASGEREPSEMSRMSIDARTRGADAPRSPLAPVMPVDRADGKLAHLDGLNLSRAWMLDGIASALEDDPRKAIFERLAQKHAAAGLASVTGEHYAGGHWLGTFATYLMTRRGREY